MVNPMWTISSCLWALSFLLFSDSTFGQIPLWGACPTVETQENFDLQRYLGKWYKVEAYFHFFELGLTCVTAEYTLQPLSASGQPPKLAVRNSGWNWLYGTQTVTDGEAYIPDPVRFPGKLKISFSNVTGPSSGIPDADYWILQTDYDTYSVVWSCTAMEIFGASFMNAQTLWILGRTPNLPDNTLSRIKDRLRGIGINPSGLGRPSEQGCPGQPGFREKPGSLPVPDRLMNNPGSAITLPQSNAIANMLPQSNVVATRNFFPNSFQPNHQFFANLQEASSATGRTEQISASENHLSWHPNSAHSHSGSLSRKRPSVSVFAAPLTVRKRISQARFVDNNLLNNQRRNRLETFL